MFNRPICSALALSMLFLLGCDKASMAPPAPQADADKTPAVVLTPPIANTSVPAADSVLTPATTATAKDESARPNGALTKAQESSAMPMPGQVNNHSTTSLDPKAVGRSASAP